LASEDQEVTTVSTSKKRNDYIDQTAEVAGEKNTCESVGGTGGAWKLVGGTLSHPLQKTFQALRGRDEREGKSLGVELKDK